MRKPLSPLNVCAYKHPVNSHLVSQTIQFINEMLRYKRRVFQFNEFPTYNIDNINVALAEFREVGWKIEPIKKGSYIQSYRFKEAA